MPTIQPSNCRGILGAVLLLATRQPASAQASAGDTTGVPPAGFGTLHQDEVAVGLSPGNVQLRIMPLDERVIRLLSPDTYQSLRQLVTARLADIERAALQHGLRRYQIFLVTFFGLQPRAQFNPEDITLTSQNRLFRPVAIVPLSVQWSESALNQRETASAIYLFEDGIVLLEPFTVGYGGLASTQWEQTIRSLEQERARVFSRAAAGPGRN